MSQDYPQCTLSSIDMQTDFLTAAHADGFELCAVAVTPTMLQDRATMAISIFQIQF